ncbi:MAG: hypothetical protein CMB31_05960 [Euryarchaeota archaeon]|nr:hypothetical protein [Euryarchaeota archaeon]
MSDEIIEMAETAINSDDFDLARSYYPQINEGSRLFIESLICIAEEDVENALSNIEKCISCVRSPKTRDPILEARAKMIRGLTRTSIGEVTEGGADLRWAMDRLGAIADGSDNHGIAILNVAEWHRQQSEIIMSLATHSEIARQSTHSDEIVAISRQRVASIHSELEDYSSALRHYWSSWKLSISTGMYALAEVTCLHIIDLGLSDVNDLIELLDEQVENAVPRPRSEKSDASINSKDLIEVVQWITPRSILNLNGTHRPDLSLIIEAHNILGIDLPSELVNNKSVIQDSEVSKLLQ